VVDRRGVARGERHEAARDAEDGLWAGGPGTRAPPLFLRDWLPASSCKTSISCDGPRWEEPPGGLPRSAGVPALAADGEGADGEVVLEVGPPRLGVRLTAAVGTTVAGLSE